MPEEQKLPKAEDISVKLNLEDAKECLRLIQQSDGLEKLKKGIQEAIERAKFWDFARDCSHLTHTVADFHFSGTGNPAYHLYCGNAKNKAEKAYRSHISAKLIRETAGPYSPCDIRSCPIYKNNF